MNYGEGTTVYQGDNRYSLKNIKFLQNRLEFRNIKVLDLYSGTGNISYELASRGALNITSVDQNRLCIDFIKRTSFLLNTKINVVQSDSINFLRKNNSQFHLIFADPPYEIDDRKAPGNGDVDAPDPGSVGQEHAQTGHEDHEQRERDRESDPPSSRGLSGLNDGSDLVGDRTQGLAGRDDGFLSESATLGRVPLVHAWPPESSSSSWRSGLGFRTEAR